MIVVHVRSFMLLGQQKYLGFCISFLYWLQWELYKRLAQNQPWTGVRQRSEDQSHSWGIFLAIILDSELNLPIGKIFPCGLTFTLVWASSSTLLNLHRKIHNKETKGGHNFCPTFLTLERSGTIEITEFSDTMLISLEDEDCDKLLTWLQIYVHLLK